MKEGFGGKEWLHKMWGQEIIGDAEMLAPRAVYFALQHFSACCPVIKSCLFQIVVVSKMVFSYSCMPFKPAPVMVVGHFPEVARVVLWSEQETGQQVANLAACIYKTD
jgi:hypothetical protein